MKHLYAYKIGSLPWKDQVLLYKNTISYFTVAGTESTSTAYKDLISSLTVDFALLKSLVPKLLCYMLQHKAWLHFTRVLA